MATKRNRAVLYLHAASPRAIARQRAQLRTFAEAQGLEILAEFSDVSQAASRPGLGGVFDTVKNNRAVRVLVDRMDRLADDPIERETIIGMILMRGGRVLSMSPAEPQEGAKAIHRAVALAEQLRIATLGGKLTASRKRLGTPGGRPVYGAREDERAVVELIHSLRRERGWAPAESRTTSTPRASPPARAENGSTTRS